MSALVVIAVIAAIGYLVSLRIHPLTKCRTCKMTGRHFGGVYKNSFRRCRTCGGTGRQDRLGAKIFFGGTGNTGFYTKKLSALPDNPTATPGPDALFTRIRPVRRIARARR